MLPPAQIPVGISSDSCLAWSSDGELAVAAGEEVYLLVPLYDTRDPWYHIHFRVNAFTYDEWPLRPQASFAEMSIGEEQAINTVTSLAWSRPGLAKHKRCVLAVLTSNLLLSIWAPGGNPADSTAWSRVLLIDVTRPRSMAWFPAFPHNKEYQISLPKDQKGRGLLAVGNDKNELFLVAISSPYTSSSGLWDGVTVEHQVIPPVHKTPIRFSLLQDALNSRPFIDYISFGDRAHSGDLPLIYRSSGTFYRSMLNISDESLQHTLGNSTTHQPLPQGCHGMPPEAPSFMDDMLRMHKKKYGVTHRQSVDEVNLRTWGLAEYDGIVAVCVTSHPARMIEYRAIFESSATVLFGCRDSSGNKQSMFPWRHPKEIDDKQIYSTILSTILDHQLLSSLTLTARDLKILYAAICATLFVELTDEQRQCCLNAGEMIKDHLAVKSGASLETEHEAIIARKLNEHASTEDLNHVSDLLIQKSDAPMAGLLDKCPICEDQNVGLYAVHKKFLEAYCPNRHPFARCALTFLPILEPGRTKQCIRCKREFLDEEKLDWDSQRPAGECSAEDQPEKSSLTTFLFDKFDVCPYCGGKYCD